MSLVVLETTSDVSDTPDSPMIDENDDSITLYERQLLEKWNQSGLKLWKILYEREKKKRLESLKTREGTNKEPETRRTESESTGNLKTQGISDKRIKDESNTVKKCHASSNGPKRVSALSDLLNNHDRRQTTVGHGHAPDQINSAIRTKTNVRDPFLQSEERYPKLCLGATATQESSDDIPSRFRPDDEISQPLLQKAKVEPRRMRKRQRKMRAQSAAFGTENNQSQENESKSRKHISCPPDLDQACAVHNLEEGTDSSPTSSPRGPYAHWDKKTHSQDDDVINLGANPNCALSCPGFRGVFGLHYAIPYLSEKLRSKLARNNKQITNNSLESLNFSSENNNNDPNCFTTSASFPCPLNFEPFVFEKEEEAECKKLGTKSKPQNIPAMLNRRSCPETTPTVFNWMNDPNYKKSQSSNALTQSNDFDLDQDCDVLAGNESVQRKNSQDYRLMEDSSTFDVSFIDDRTQTSSIFSSCQRNDQPMMDSSIFGADNILLGKSLCEDNYTPCTSASSFVKLSIDSGRFRDFQTPFPVHNFTNNDFNYVSSMPTDDLSAPNSAPFTTHHLPRDNRELTESNCHNKNILSLESKSFEPLREENYEKSFNNISVCKHQLNPKTLSNPPPTQYLFPENNDFRSESACSPGSMVAQCHTQPNSVYATSLSFHSNDMGTVDTIVKEGCKDDYDDDMDDENDDPDADDEFECECDVCVLVKAKVLHDNEHPIEDNNTQAEEVPEDNLSNRILLDRLQNEMNLGRTQTRDVSSADAAERPNGLEPFVPMDMNFDTEAESPYSTLLHSRRSELEEMFESILQLMAIAPDLSIDLNPPPADPEVIKSIPTTSIQDIDNANGNQQCSICLSNYETEDTISYLPCEHYFHQLCINTWLEKSGTCPVCRKLL